MSPVECLSCDVVEADETSAMNHGCQKLFSRRKDDKR